MEVAPAGSPSKQPRSVITLNRNELLDCALHVLSAGFLTKKKKNNSKDRIRVKSPMTHPAVDDRGTNPQSDDEERTHG